MERKNNIGLLHFLAAVGVMLGHQYVLLGGTAPAIFGMDIHSLSVRVIFVITGYLITESYYNSNSIGKYLWKRIKRIYPPLILSILLCVIVLGPLFSSFSFLEYLGMSKSYIFQNVLLSPRFDLPGVFVDNIYPYAVNGSLWTLPVEIMCYLLIIPVMKICDLLGKYGNLFLGFLTAALWMVYTQQLTGQITGFYVVWGTDWFSAVQVAAYFWMGSFFARAKLKKYCNVQVAVVVGVICSLMYGYSKCIAYLPVITYITLSFAFADKPVFSKFKGKLSYELYLYGFPIQQSLVQLLIIRGGTMHSPMEMFALSFVITLAVSYFANKFIESLMSGKLHENIKKYISADKMKEQVKSAVEQVTVPEESETEKDVEDEEYGEDEIGEDKIEEDEIEEDEIEVGEFEVRKPKVKKAKIKKAERKETVVDDSEEELKEIAESLYRDLEILDIEDLDLEEIDLDEEDE